MATVCTFPESVDAANAAGMVLHTIDPLSDRRWDDLVASHPKASIFHHAGWLKALARTYGYRPLALTSAPAGKPLRDGIIFCSVESKITGNRLVSVPFADHCEPLLSDNVQPSEVQQWIRNEYGRDHWKYIELRPLSWDQNARAPLVADQSFWLHTLSLEPSLETIYAGFHKHSMQRRIRRAEREGLSYEIGRSEALLRDFYKLVVTTRKRHHLLPQPRAWFRNLIACLDQNVQIRMARKGDVPIAALLTLSHGKAVVYKYGCSEHEFHHLAAMPFLFWRMIEESKSAGAESIDFGRTDLDHGGLIAFKDRFGTARRLITYLRYPNTKHGGMVTDVAIARRFFSLLPDVLLPWAGSVVYRHIG